MASIRYLNVSPISIDANNFMYLEGNKMKYALLDKGRRLLLFRNTYKRTVRSLAVLVNMVTLSGSF